MALPAKLVSGLFSLLLIGPIGDILIGSPKNDRILAFSEDPHKCSLVVLCMGDILTGSLKMTVSSFS